MNFSEEQKKLLLNYMKEHIDFGRGRLRYAGENKRIMDQMWQEVAMKLNSSGSGPQKLPKEWNKTWRNWKGNTLKKAADNKSYAMGTGGGPPKVKVLTSLEMKLLDFLTPEASGLDIAQGGFQYLTSDQSNIKTRPLEDALNINISSRKMQRLSQSPVPSTSFQTKSNCMEMEFSTPKAPKVFDSMNDDDSDIEFFISTNNNKENIKNQETASCDTETIARKLKRNKTTNKEIDNFFTEKSSKTQFKGSKTNTTETAVDLLRHKMEIKEEENERIRKYTEERMQIEREKLRLKEDKLQFEKSKFQYITTVHSEYLGQLENINSNIIELRQVVERYCVSHET